MKTIKLFFKDKEFLEEKKFQFSGSELAILEIRHEENVAELTFTSEINLIDRKIAERQAQSICKTGFLLESGERVGSGCTLVIA